MLSELLQMLEAAHLLPLHITTFMTFLHEVCLTGLYSLRITLSISMAICLWVSVVRQVKRRVGVGYAKAHEYLDWERVCIVEGLCWNISEIYDDS